MATTEEAVQEVGAWAVAAWSWRAAVLILFH